MYRRKTDHCGPSPLDTQAGARDCARRHTSADEEHTSWHDTLDSGQSKWFVGFVRPDGWAFVHLGDGSRSVEQRCGYEVFIAIDAAVLTVGPGERIACTERRLPWL